MANPEEFRGTVPPNSVEAEVSVLGAMLQDSAAVLRATEHLRPELGEQRLRIGFDQVVFRIARLREHLAGGFRRHLPRHADRRSRTGFQGKEHPPGTGLGGIRLVMVIDQFYAVETTGSEALLQQVGKCGGRRLECSISYN